MKFPNQKKLVECDSVKETFDFVQIHVFFQIHLFQFFNFSVLLHLFLFFKNGTIEVNNVKRTSSRPVVPIYAEHWGGG